MSKRQPVLIEEATAEMLRKMEAVFATLDIDYYLVGAMGRDIQFARKGIDFSFRKTDDVDLAVYVADEDKYNNMMKALLATGEFKRDEKEIIKLHYHLGLEVDLIPFGGIENKKREVRLTKPKAFTLQMPGFAEVFPFVESFQSGDFTLYACPLEGIVMLKLISYEDRPERLKDLTDIDNIVDHYFDWNAEEIYQKHNDLFDRYNVDDIRFYQPMIAAHAIGRRIATLIESNANLKKRIMATLTTRDNPRWVALLSGLQE